MGQPLSARKGVDGLRGCSSEPYLSPPKSQLPQPMPLRGSAERRTQEYIAAEIGVSKASFSCISNAAALAGVSSRAVKSCTPLLSQIF